MTMTAPPIKRSSFFINLPLYCAVVTLILVQSALFTSSAFSPLFVWATVNKSLEEDRLLVVDANSEKVKIKGCVRVVLYNQGSLQYKKTNHSGTGHIFVDATHPNFSTPAVVDKVKEEIDKINQGICVPCIVVISVVNVSANQEERKYRHQLGELRNLTQIRMEEKFYQDYKLQLSQQLTLLLQYKTPIAARHLILLRLVDTQDELTKGHGKKYTRYPRRLVSLWEQVLFDHFREARVIQGSLDSALGKRENKVLISGKENGIWVWMCEEIIARQEKQEQCEQTPGQTEKEKCFDKLTNSTTADVEMDNLNTCRMYRARS